MIQLNEIYPDPFGVKKSKRLGRGPGSGKGKTSGKGHKGQNARSGTPFKMTGGQTPLSRILPKVGFRRPRSNLDITITTDKINYAIECHKLSKEVSLSILINAKIIPKNIKNCKIILGKSKLDAGIKIGEGLSFSKSIKY